MAFQRHALPLALLTTVLASSAILAQRPPDPATLIAAQRQGMASLAYMDGVWRGPATVMSPTGETMKITQTERIGPFLDGSLKVIEGRGYRADGTPGFNAFGIISYNPADKSYTMRSYAQGYHGDFALTPTADGYTWEVPAGPGATIRYTAVVKDGKWREVGDRIAGGGPPVRIFEMNLVRVGDSDWPVAGTIKPQ